MVHVQTCVLDLSLFKLGSRLADAKGLGFLLPLLLGPVLALCGFCRCAVWVYGLPLAALEGFLASHFSQVQISNFFWVSLWASGLAHITLLVFGVFHFMLLLGSNLNACGDFPLHRLGIQLATHRAIGIYGLLFPIVARLVWVVLFFPPHSMSFTHHIFRVWPLRFPALDCFFDQVQL